MALDLTGGVRRVRPGTRILVWCDQAADQPRVAGLPLWQRAVYTACRAGFARLLIVTSQRSDVVRQRLAGDHRLEGREWDVVAAAEAGDGGWLRLLRSIGGRWVALGAHWIVDDALLVRLAESEGPPVVAAPGGPVAAEAADLERWSVQGWTPSTSPPVSPAPLAGQVSLLVRVDDEAGARAAEDALFLGLARNVSNFFARVVDRGMSRAISRRLAGTTITPNQITIFSTLLGIVGSLVMLDPSWSAGALGAFLFFAHTVIDGCDGEIARLKFQESASGAKLDLIGDNVVHAFLFPCVSLRFYFADPGGPFLILGAVALLGVIVTWLAVYFLIVRGQPSPGLLRLFETFANREFAYLVLVLGLAGRLDWFVWAMAFGLWIFPVALFGLWARERRP